MSTMRPFAETVRIERDADLRPLNTLRVAARARYLAQVRDSDALAGLLDNPMFAALPVLVLGEGSNLLLTGNFDGLVLRLLAQRISETAIDADSALITAEAGVGWDELVTWSLAQGYGGIENLALIPGLCGAAPIQNIGAYGAELSDTLREVEAFDRHTRTAIVLTHADCQFGYRDSLFKRAPDRYIITAIRLLLSRKAPLRMDYAGIREELEALEIGAPNAADVAVAVRRLRRRKLPQPSVLPNAGSSSKTRSSIKPSPMNCWRRNPTMPYWQTPKTTQVKLSAGWLIEQAGFKGYRSGDAGIAAGHALVLVNHGDASGAELLALARKVQDEVLRKFAVKIEPEPVIV